MEVILITLILGAVCVLYVILLKLVKDVCNLYSLLDLVSDRQFSSNKKIDELNRKFCDLENLIKEDMKNRLKPRAESENLVNLRKAFTIQNTEVNGRS